MDISAVILNYKDAKNAINVVEILKRISLINHIVVVDNNSNDGSIRQLESIEGIVFIKSNENNGFAAGNNLGMKYAWFEFHSDYIFVINTDVIFDETLVVKCVAAMQGNGNIGAISSRIKNPRGNEERSAWKFPTYIEYLLFNSILLNRILKIGQEIQYPISENTPPIISVDAIRGSFMCFRGKVLDEVGYFDETTFLYNEENIICKKIKNCGWDVGLLTDLFYIHNHKNKTGNKYSSVRMKWKYFQSNYRFQSKYNDISMIQKIIFRMAMVYGISEKVVFNGLYFMKEKISG